MKQPVTKVKINAPEKQDVLTAFQQFLSDGIAQLSINTIVTHGYSRF